MNQSRFALTLAAVLFCSAIPHTLFGTTTNLVPIADTALRSSVPDNNFGAVTPLPIGVAVFGSPINRCLFKFNLADIPTNAVINSVTLRLIVATDPTPPANFSVNRLLQDWGEGAGLNVPFIHNGAPAVAGEATWNSRFHLSAPWGAGGGQAGTDFVATFSATNLLATGTNDFTSPDLASDVQLWLQHPNTNFGWIVFALGEPSDTGKLVASREDPNNAPTLSVDYSLSSFSAAAPPTIFGMSLVGNQIRFSFNAESNRTYAVEFRNSLLDGDWSVLTNIAAQPVEATINITNTISSPQRFYRTRTP
jgi:hypothetical protein